MRIPALILIALCLSTHGNAADFATGAAAYDGGRYTAAFAEWSVLARRGESRAQVAIAGMYLSGTGRDADSRKAAFWYRRAAAAGDVIAQLNYAELLETGRGVGRDRGAARLWYGRAADQGNAWAAAQRDRLDRLDRLDRGARERPRR